jgi:hypothetical protein
MCGEHIIIEDPLDGRVDQMCMFQGFDLAVGLEIATYIITKLILIHEKYLVIKNYHKFFILVIIL